MTHEQIAEQIIDRLFAISLEYDLCVMLRHGTSGFAATNIHRQKKDAVKIIAALIKELQHDPKI